MVSPEIPLAQPAPPAGRRLELSSTAWGLLALAVIAVVLVLSSLAPGVPAPPR